MPLACLKRSSTTWTRVRAVSFHRTTLSPTRRRDGTTGATRVREVVVYVEHPWTPSFQLEHGKIRSTAEARGHYACVSVSPRGTEPRGLTETQSRRADLFTFDAVPGRSAALDVCGILQCSGSPRVMQHKLLLNERHPTVEEKSQTCVPACDVSNSKSDPPTSLTSSALHTRKGDMTSQEKPYGASMCNVGVDVALSMVPAK